MKERMNRTHIARKTAVKAGVKPKEAERIIKAAFEAISDELSQKNTVSIVGFGQFKAKRRKKRIGRNPNTGKSMELPESDSLGFKASRELSRIIKGKPKYIPKKKS